MYFATPTRKPPDLGVKFYHVDEGTNYPQQRRSSSYPQHSLKVNESGGSGAAGEDQNKVELQVKPRLIYIVFKLDRRE